MKRVNPVINPEDYASLPSRERGLKLGIDELDKKEKEVAPLAGAWIETHLNVVKKRRLPVAPLAGAWIETF